MPALTKAPPGRERRRPRGGPRGRHRKGPSGRLRSRPRVFLSVSEDPPRRRRARSSVRPNPHCTPPAAHPELNCRMLCRTRRRGRGWFNPRNAYRSTPMPPETSSASDIITRAFGEGRPIVPFLGAGVSVGTGFPTMTAITGLPGEGAVPHPPCRRLRPSRRAVRRRFPPPARVARHPPAERRRVESPGETARRGRRRGATPGKLLENFPWVDSVAAPLPPPGGGEGQGPLGDAATSGSGSPRSFSSSRCSARKTGVRPRGLWRNVVSGKVEFAGIGTT